MDLTPYTQTLTLTNVGFVFQLAILEGLLSFDNALALAALVSDRLKNPDDRKKALLWGIWGAYVTRTGVVFIGVWLMANPWIRFIAGAYLLWLAVHELFLKKKDDPTPEQEAHQFRFPSEEQLQQVPPQAGWKALWKTILAVELMDVMFSIDSIAVALAVSDEKWVLITGAIVGILMMRVAATYFIKLIDKFPILVPTAFVLVGIAGLKVVLEIESLPFGQHQLGLIGLHIPEGVFLPVMLSVLIGAIVLNSFYPEKFRKKS